MSRPWVIIKVLYDTCNQIILYFFHRRDGPYQCSCHFSCLPQEKIITKILSVEQLYDCSHVYGEEGGENCSFFSSQHILSAVYMLCFFRLAALLFFTRLETVWRDMMPFEWSVCTKIRGPTVVGLYLYREFEV